MTRWLWTIVMGLSTGCVLGQALAATPRNGDSRAIGPRPSTQQHLDLRVPSHTLDASAALAGKGIALRRGTIAPLQPLPSQETVHQLPAFGADGMRTRPPLEEFVRRVHREGLPVARLFESKSALVHLGLSPKGKPGLWLVQKTH